MNRINPLFLDAMGRRHPNLGVDQGEAAPVLLGRALEQKSPGPRGGFRVLVAAASRSLRSLRGGLQGILGDVAADVEVAGARATEYSLKCSRIVLDDC